jgi:ubiquinone/menaquinone biosynthesis C-methylase UbiE
MTAPQDWWKDFFSGLVVDFWRAAMPPEATRAEADFFALHLALAPGARVLDVACGDGRLALELARRGFSVTGVDISEEFLEAGRRSAAQQGLVVAWRQSDMRDLPWREELDGAFCGGSSFGFLGDAGDRAFLQAVARTLKPGARFAIDAVKAAEVVAPYFRDRHTMEVQGIRFEAENRYDPAAGWMESRYTLSRGDRSEVRAARHRIYTYREVEAMLEESGFEEIEGLGSLSGEPFAPGVSRLIFVAARGRSRNLQSSATPAPPPLSPGR